MAALKTVIVDMTFPEVGNYARALSNMMYSVNEKPRYMQLLRDRSNNPLDVLDREQWSGCPNDGGQHVFKLRNLSIDDALAWLDLFNEKYGHFPQTDYVRSQLQSGWIRVKVLGAKYWDELKDD